MKVLLLQDVKGIGRKYDLKDVKDGYARNFLLPKKLAVVADAKSLKIKQEAENRARATIQHYQEAARRLENETLIFKVKTGAKGEVFGSVNKDDIQRALKEKGLEVGEIVLPHPLKKIGDHTVEVVIGGGIGAKVKVVLNSLLANRYWLVFGTTLTIVA